MELRHLRSFLVLAEELHQGRAAARLGIEQSSLSRQISDLEEELQATLFMRTTRGTWLSDAGSALLESARRIIADEQMTRAQVALHWNHDRRLRLGFAEGFVGAQVAAMLVHLESEPHDIRTVVVERPMSDLITMLVTGAIDAVFGPEQANTADSISLPAWTEPLTLLVPDSARGSMPVSLTELGLPLFRPDPLYLPGFAAQVDAIIPPTLPLAASRFATVPAVYALVATGCGFGILPRSMAMASERVHLRSIRTKRARINFWMTVRKDDPTPAVGLLRRAVEAGVIRAAPPRPA